MKKRRAVYPGSFDPITYGHMDIIERASKLFDEVIVLVAVNPSKNSLFSVDEKIEMISNCIRGIDNVVVDNFTGLLVDYLRMSKADAVIKGLRAVSDFEYEFQMALANKKLFPAAETLFLTTSPKNMYLSSSVVRQIGSFGGDISSFVPKCILEDIKNKFKGVSKDE